MIQRIQSVYLALGVIALAALLFAGGVAHAQVILEVILEVDVSNPSAVVFTSADATAQITVSDVPSAEGIVLSFFFLEPIEGDPFVTTFDSGAINVFDSSAERTSPPWRWPTSCFESRGSSSRAANTTTPRSPPAPEYDPVTSFLTIATVILF